MQPLKFPTLRTCIAKIYGKFGYPAERVKISSVSDLIVAGLQSNNPNLSDEVGRMIYYIGRQYIFSKFPTLFSSNPVPIMTLNIDEIPHFMTQIISNPHLKDHFYLDLIGPMLSFMIFCKGNQISSYRETLDWAIDAIHNTNRNKTQEAIAGQKGFSQWLRFSLGINHLQELMEQNEFDEAATWANKLKGSIDLDKTYKFHRLEFWDNLFRAHLYKKKYNDAKKDLQEFEKVFITLEDPEKEFHAKAAKLLLSLASGAVIEGILHLKERGAPIQPDTIFNDILKCCELQDLYQIVNSTYNLAKLASSHIEEIFASKVLKEVVFKLESEGTPTIHLFGPIEPNYLCEMLIDTSIRTAEKIFRQCN